MAAESAGPSEVDRRIEELLNRNRPAEQRPEEPPRPDRANENLPIPGPRGGVVVVLSGGGTKGFAHIGVLKVLEQQDIPIVGIVGTSMGSVIGGMYACGYSADEIYDIVMETNIMGLLADSGTRIKPGAGDHRPVGETAKLYQINLNKNLKTVGPLGVLPAVSLVNFLTQYTGRVQTANFDELPIPFACVATDLGTGEMVVMRDGNLASSIRASVAIPGLLEPWPLDGRLLVDGGLVDNLPVGIAKEIFPGYPVVAVNLAGPTIAKSNDRFSSVVDVLMQTIDIMTVERLKWNEAQADIVLYPDVTGFSMLDASGYDKIYDRGYEVAKANVEGIVALSANAPPPPERGPSLRAEAIVRSVRVEGLQSHLTRDVEKAMSVWIGKPYDYDRVNKAAEQLTKREEVATVDIDIVMLDREAPNDVEVVLTVEKRAPYEIAIGGYTSNMHRHRWISLMANARDLASYGDSANFEARVADDEWGIGARYFTPLMNQGQWGFALNARREKYDPRGYGSYAINRESMRAVYYKENLYSRIGLGLAGEWTNAAMRDEFSWGPYFYFNTDTLDNMLTPTRGVSFNSQVWWNTSSIWVSRTNLTAYVPWRSHLHFVLNFGLETGDKHHQVYRALLGDQEGLFSAARHPLVGDQAAWAHVGLGKNFYSSWWGSLRGELFATYGMVMEDWSRTEDAWETGVAFSVPGQFFNARFLVVYSDEEEFTFGFSIGDPRWWASPLP